MNIYSHLKVLSLSFLIIFCVNVNAAESSSKLSISSSSESTTEKDKKSIMSFFRYMYFYNKIVNPIKVRLDQQEAANEQIKQRLDLHEQRLKEEEESTQLVKSAVGTVKGVLDGMDKRDKENEVRIKTLEESQASIKKEMDERLKENQDKIKRSLEEIELNHREIELHKQNLEILKTDVKNHVSQIKEIQIKEIQNNIQQCNAKIKANEEAIKSYEQFQQEFNKFSSLPSKIIKRLEIMSYIACALLHLADKYNIDTQEIISARKDLNNVCSLFVLYRGYNVFDWIQNSIGSTKHKKTTSALLAVVGLAVLKYKNIL